MCGFIGYISKKEHSKNPLYRKKLDIYYELLKKRGPDFQTKKKIDYENYEINIGYTRLAIQDLKENSNQIFHNDRYILLFNGEIYNKDDLFKKYLTNQKLKTNTDTEILFHLIINKGTEIISNISGIFSIIFIDLEKKDIFSIKDVTGTKPLYYMIDGGNYLFSSEAWFLYSVSSKKINYKSLSFYLNFGFTPHGQTLIEDVKKIRPSEIAKYNFENKTLNIKSYFNFNLEKKNITNQKIINESINATIEKNLLSDTKVGTFLSGGIDSTTITILAKQFNPNIEAFTTIFSPKDNFRKFNIDFDYSSKVAKEYGIKLNIKNVNLENNLFDDFMDMANYLDEPVSNFNMMNSYWQSKMAKEANCKVVLTGDGADELFFGYERYKKIFLSEKLFFLNFLNKKIKKINKINNEELVNHIHSKFKNFSIEKIFYNKSNFNNEYIKSIFTQNNFDTKLDQINYFDIYHWLSNENNYKLDKSTMINSIEARVPFQDINLLNLIYNAKSINKFNFINPKFLLKNLNVLPQYIKKRKKIGWFAPEKYFMLLNFNKITNLFFEKEKKIKQEIFNYEYLKKNFDFFTNNKDGYLIKNQILSLIIFQIWYRNITNLK